MDVFVCEERLELVDAFVLLSDSSLLSLFNVEISKASTIHQHSQIYIQPDTERR